MFINSKESYKVTVIPNDQSGMTYLGAFYYFSWQIELKLMLMNIK